MHQYDNSHLPSPTKTVNLTLTELELMALKNPKRNSINKKFRSVDSIEGEEWRVIPKTHGLYSVSNLGRLKKHYVSKLGKEQEFLMCSSKNSSGNCFASLTIAPGYKVSTYIHRLVLLAFNYVEGCESMDVIHIDCDNTNNRYSEDPELNNLRWATRSEAQMWKKEHCGIQKPKLKSKEYINKKGVKKVKRMWLSDGDVLKIRELYAAGVSQYKISELYGCTQAFISKIVNKKLRSEI